VAFRIAPVTRAEACDMIRELRAFAILDGARGKPNTLTRCNVMVITSVKSSIRQAA